VIGKSPKRKKKEKCPVSCLGDGSATGTVGRDGGGLRHEPKGGESNT